MKSRTSEKFEILGNYYSSGTNIYLGWRSIFKARRICEKLCNFQVRRVCLLAVILNQKVYLKSRFDFFLCWAFQRKLWIPVMAGFPSL